jgi:hypothetical protein
MYSRNLSLCRLVSLLIGLIEDALFSEAKRAFVYACYADADRESYVTQAKILNNINRLMAAHFREGNA